MISTAVWGQLRMRTLIQAPCRNRVVPINAGLFPPFVLIRHIALGFIATVSRCLLLHRLVTTKKRPTGVRMQ